MARIPLDGHLSAYLYFVCNRRSISDGMISNLFPMWYLLYTFQTTCAAPTSEGLSLLKLQKNDKKKLMKFVIQ